MLVVIICFPFLLLAVAAPISARLLDSVPPEVNTISFGWHFISDAILSAASLTYFSAAIPFVCLDEGFP